MRKSCDSVSTICYGITGNRIVYGSEYLSDEDISGSSAFSFSVGISSEVCYISGVRFREIESGSCYGFLDRGAVFIGKDSDFISFDIDKSIFVIYTIRISIGLIYKALEYTVI